MASVPVHLVEPGEAIAAGVALPALSIVIVALRFSARRWQGVRHGVDDWLTIPALVLLIGMAVSLVIGEVLGVERYSLNDVGDDSTFRSSATDANDEAYSIASKCLWAFQLMMYPMTALTKISILFFYRRVFWPQAYPKLGLATLVTSIVIAAWSLVFFFLNIFDCGPDVSLNWLPFPQYVKKCFADVGLEQPYAITDLILNVILLLLPLPTIHKLQLCLRRRLAVGFVMLLGSFALAASIVRVILLVGLIEKHPNLEVMDQMPAVHSIVHIWSTMMYWSVIEAGLALQTACLPTLCLLLPVTFFGPGKPGRNGSLVTQRGNGTRGPVWGRYGTGNGPPAGEDPSTAADYPRSSGWFARYRAPPINPDGVGAERLSFERIASDAESEISVLDLEAPVEGGADLEEERRGRSEKRAWEEKDPEKI